jgi:hypothetical protein
MDRPLSDLSLDERAERDANQTDEEGNFVPHVYKSDIRAYHNRRSQIDPDYQPPEEPAD